MTVSYLKWDQADAETLAFFDKAENRFKKNWMDRSRQRDMTLKDIEIFTGPSCAYCAAAKALLQEKGLSFTERNISDPQVAAEFRQRFPSVRSIPQVIADGEHIGGFEDLQMQLDQAGR